MSARKYVVRFIGGSYLLSECLTTINETTARRFDTVADADAAIRIAVELRRTERHWHWHGREVGDWRVEPAGVFTDSRPEIEHLRGVLARSDARRPEYLRGLGVTAFAGRSLTYGYHYRSVNICLYCLARWPWPAGTRCPKNPVEYL